METKGICKLRRAGGMARPVRPDALRIRGVLKSPHEKALTVEEMDEGVAKYLRERHGQAARRRKPSGR